MTQSSLKPLNGHHSASGGNFVIDYKIQDDALAVRGFSPLGYLPPSAISFDQWTQDGEALRLVLDASKFAIGDWINYGIAKWGSKYDQAIHSGFGNYNKLTKYAWVAGKVPRLNRRPVLTWTHHHHVASLRVDCQVEWLEAAIDKGWDTEDLRDELTLAQLKAEGWKVVNGLIVPPTAELQITERIKKVFERDPRVDKYALHEGAALPELRPLKVFDPQPEVLQVPAALPTVVDIPQPLAPFTEAEDTTDEDWFDEDEELPFTDAPEEAAAAAATHVEHYEDDWDERRSRGDDDDFDESGGGFLKITCPHCGDPMLLSFADAAAAMKAAGYVWSE